MMKKMMQFAWVSIVLTIFCGTAFADWGPRGEMGKSGGKGYGLRNMPSLTEEQQTALDAERKAFFEATREQSQLLRQKRFELMAEMAKSNPNAEQAKSLQKEISDIRSQLAQKRLDHMLKVKEIAPSLSAGAFGRGFGGKGKHRGGGRW